MSILCNQLSNIITKKFDYLFISDQFQEVWSDQISPDQCFSVFQSEQCKIRFLQSKNLLHCELGSLQAPNHVERPPESQAQRNWFPVEWVIDYLAAKPIDFQIEIKARECALPEKYIEDLSVEFEPYANQAFALFAPNADQLFTDFLKDNQLRRAEIDRAILSYLGLNFPPTSI